MTRKGLTLAAILAALLLSACWEHPEQPPNPDTLMVHGERLYLEYCAECHQRNGSGWKPLYPNFAGNPLITLHDPEPIIVIVLYGQGSMPAFGTKLTTDDVSAILTYIRNSWGNEASPVSPRQIN
jgi:mono/diheme cytochrome c family protein